MLPNAYGYHMVSVFFFNLQILKFKKTSNFSIVVPIFLKTLKKNVKKVPKVNSGANGLSS